MSIEERIAAAAEALFRALAELIRAVIRMFRNPEVAEAEQRQEQVSEAMREVEDLKRQVDEALAEQPRTAPREKPEPDVVLVTRAIKAISNGKTPDWAALENRAPPEIQDWLRRLTPFQADCTLKYTPRALELHWCGAMELAGIPFLRREAGSETVKRPDTSVERQPVVQTASP